MIPALITVLLLQGACSPSHDPDATPPSRVDDLAVVGRTDAALTLAWTASGDDDLTGRASEYDLRLSRTSITDDGWTQLERVATSVPQQPGTVETLSVAGLESGTRYFFALRVLDEEGNASPRSNVAEGWTLGDGAPEAVDDLVANATSASTVALRWTAPNDPSKVPDAASKSIVSAYEIRYGTSPITEGNVQDAVEVTDSPQPGEPGAAEAFSVGGLSSGTHYYFVVRSMDDAGNLSPISNVAEAETEASTSHWELFEPDHVLIGAPTTLVVHEGQLYVGGDLDGYLGISIRHVARWTGAGWEQGGETVSTYVNHMFVYQGSLYMIGSGQYGYAFWTFRRYIDATDRWIEYGGLCSIIDPGSVPARLYPCSDGTIIIGNGFDTPYVRYDGNTWEHAFDTADRRFDTITERPNGDLVLAGGLGGSNDFSSRVVIWNGAELRQLGGALTGVAGIDYGRRELTAYGDEIALTGSYAYIDGLVPISSPSRWDGEDWTSAPEIPVLPTNSESYQVPPTHIKYGNGEYRFENRYFVLRKGNWETSTGQVVPFELTDGTWTPLMTPGLVSDPPRRAISLAWFEGSLLCTDGDRIYRYVE